MNPKAILTIAFLLCSAGWSMIYKDWNELVIDTVIDGRRRLVNIEGNYNFK